MCTVRDPGASGHVVSAADELAYQRDRDHRIVDAIECLRELSGNQVRFLTGLERPHVHTFTGRDVPTSSGHHHAIAAEVPLGRLISSVVRHARNCIEEEPIVCWTNFARS
jgi:hypothetical protein